MRYRRRDRLGVSGWWGVHEGRSFAFRVLSRRPRPFADSAGGWCRCGRRKGGRADNPLLAPRGRSGVGPDVGLADSHRFGNWGNAPTRGTATVPIDTGSAAHGGGWLNDGSVAAGRGRTRRDADIEPFAPDHRSGEPGQRVGMPIDTGSAARPSRRTVGRVKYWVIGGLVRSPVRRRTGGHADSRRPSADPGSPPTTADPAENRPGIGRSRTRGVADNTKCDGVRT